MDLSLFFAGTAGSVPTPKRGLPALLLRAGGERLLFDCGEGTQHQLLRSRRAARTSTRSSSPTCTSTTGSGCRGCSRPSTCATANGRSTSTARLASSPLPASATAAYRPDELPADVDRARATRGDRVRGLRHRRVPGQAPRRGVRIRVRRGRPARPLRRRGRARLGHPAWPRLRPAPARRDRQRRHARAGHGPDRAGPPDRLLRRHRAVPDRRGLRPRRRRARPRGDVLRGREGARARDRPLDRQSGRPDSRRRERRSCSR